MDIAGRPVQDLHQIPSSHHPPHLLTDSHLTTSEELEDQGPEGSDVGSGRGEAEAGDLGGEVAVEEDSKVAEAHTIYIYRYMGKRSGIGFGGIKPFSFCPRTGIKMELP